MRVFDILSTTVFYCFTFCFMRFYFWLIEPKPSKKSKQKEVTKNRLSMFWGLHYFDIYKKNKLFVLIYFILFILFIFSFILSISKCLIQSDFVIQISNISGKILWYYFCIIGIVYWLVLEIRQK